MIVALLILLLCRIIAEITANDEIKLYDLLAATGVYKGRDGVKMTQGFCHTRPGSDESNSSDVAYTVDKYTPLSFETSILFPERLPYNFSVLLAFRAAVTYTGNIFGFYAESSDPKIAVQLSEAGSIIFYYEDGTRDFDQPFKYYPTFHLNVTDSNWHRLAFSINGDLVTLYADGHLISSQHLLRKETPLSNEGLILVASQFHPSTHTDVSDIYFEGDLQIVQLVSSPDAASRFTEDFLPECNKSLPEIIRVLQEAATEDDVPGNVELGVITLSAHEEENEILDGNLSSTSAAVIPEVSDTTTVEVLTTSQLSCPVFPVDTRNAGPSRRGLKGQKGEPGSDGIPGRDGEAGPPGNIYFLPVPLLPEKGECASVESYRRLLNDFKPSLRGPVGITGLNGLPGPKGSRGRDGRKGDIGRSGPPGVPGNEGREGTPGQSGKPGIPGKDGPSGPPGPSGSRGPSGFPGIPGLPGAKGQRGATGTTGEPGEQGPPGDQGDVGEPGSPGHPGDVGPKGLTGPRGHPGEHGYPGPQGDSGPPGPKGDVGSVGHPGADGPIGPPGEKGDSGSSGPPGEQGQPGEKGQKGKVGDVGPVGEKGDRGPVGPAGQKGETGLPGPTCESGIKGDKGAKGSKGDVGLKGDQGQIGEQGITGKKGDAGMSGQKGDKGDPGSPGKQGAEGTTGAKGDSGVKGHLGPKGEKGDVGQTGPPGLPGQDGEKGSKGDKGSIGTDGRKGEKGENGIPGPPGEQGYPGSDGERGQHGDPGGYGDKGNIGEAGEPGLPGQKGDRGEVGLIGPPGDIGPPGSPGNNGTQGNAGSKGDKGNPGKPGNDGMPGLSCTCGISGDKPNDQSIKEPLQCDPSSLRPLKGDPGSRGPSGPKGDKGSFGLKGNRGDKGPTGQKGDKGQKGQKGSTGVPGSKGSQGSPGNISVLPPSLAKKLWKHRTKRDDSKADILADILTSIHALKRGIQKMKSPMGERFDPARSCTDLKHSHLSLENGYFWIDPNAGSPHDAINVFCNFATGETCVNADDGKNFSKLRHYSKKRLPGERWFSQLRNGFKVTYSNAGHVQLNFLRLMHYEAVQNLTISCKNSVIWYDDRKKNYRSSIRIMGQRNTEWSARRKHLKPTRVDDQCSVFTNVSRTGKTTFTIKTTKLDQLPLIDFLPYDYGGKSQMIGFEIGPLCFR